MRTRSMCISMLFLVASLAPGCNADSDSAAGFRLPEGDPERGQVAFVALGCNSCHTVAGLDLPAPVADPPVGVDLAGVVAGRRTDGALVTSIIHPDHEIAMRFAGGKMEYGGHTRMGDYSETMTVHQLVDLVAFIQSRYREPAPLAGL